MLPQRLKQDDDDGVSDVFEFHFNVMGPMLAMPAVDDAPLEGFGPVSCLDLSISQFVYLAKES